MRKIERIKEKEKTKAIDSTRELSLVRGEIHMDLCTLNFLAHDQDQEEKKQRKSNDDEDHELGENWLRNWSMTFPEIFILSIFVS